jgi:hypothetical protein
MSSIATARLGPPGEVGGTSPDAADHPGGPARREVSQECVTGSAENAVTALYQAHALA